MKRTGLLLLVLGVLVSLANAQEMERWLKRAPLQGFSISSAHDVYEPVKNCE